MTDLMGRIAELSDEQRELLRRRLAKAKAGKNLDSSATTGNELVATPREEGVEVPLSFAQESTWFRDRLHPGNPIHNITGALRLEGQLVKAALQASLDGIVARHETLRARFRAPEGEPEQTIQEPFSVPLSEVDLRGLSPEDRSQERARLFEQELRKGFDLTQDHLIRAELLRLGEDSHLLLFTMHHIASDGWSIGVVMAELSELYTAELESREPNLPELPVQYGDFVIWQRKRLASILDHSLAYWRTQLDNPPTVLALPADQLEHGAEPEGFALGQTSSLNLDPSLKKRLDELSRGEDATLFATLLSGFMALMMRCTGQEDLLVGTPVSGRSRVETEGLVGLFVNTLAVRAQLSPTMSFRDALAAVRKTILAGLEHHEVPFERVVRDLKQEGAGRRLFDTVFNFTPGPVRDAELPGLSVQVEPPPQMPAEFATQLYINEWQGELELKLVYPGSLYSEARMDAFLEQLRSVFEQVVEHPESALGNLDLVVSATDTQAGTQGSLPDPTQALEKPAHRPVIEQIHDWVAQSPEHPALQHADRSVSYGELGASASAVARTLAAAGLKPGDGVAVLGPRIPEVVVAMVGVFYARGILTTLSQNLPETRQRSMLEQSEARYLVRVGEPRKEDDWVTSLESLQTIDLIALSDLDSVSSELEFSSPTDALDDRAYVFFTSGSTGTPKGILGSHVGLAHFLDWQRQTFSVGPDDRCAQLTGLSFDVVLRDVFLPLSSGATLVFPDSEEATGSDMLRWLSAHHITLLHTVPSVLETWLLDPPDGVPLPELSRLFVAGEPLTAELISRWRSAFPEAGQMVNLYGPTETTLAKLFYPVPETLLHGVQPVGRPIPNTQAVILTADHRLCGLGEPGHIAVRTPFRSHGYLTDDQAERFIANPFTDDHQDLLYLTGDRGRYGKDGQVEFLGRIDHQVKIRGIRIEPTEIAVVLESHKAVAACAVVVREGAGPEGPILVAYVVPAKGADADPETLQSFLRQHLPAAMVPTAFVQLDALPLTANHKLDRSKLPAPDGMRPDLNSSYLAPRDAIELQLVQVWEQLLKVRPVGVRDDFFALGGHSLMALHLLVRIQQRLGVKVPLGPFLQGPNIEHLADVVRQREQSTRTLVPLWAAEHATKLFVVHPGGGTLLNYVHLVRHSAGEHPIFGLQARGLDGKSEPHRDLQQMAEDYIEEIREAQPEGPYLLAGHSLGGLIAFEIGRQLQDAGQTVAMVALFDSNLSRQATDDGLDDQQRDARSLADMAEVIGRFSGKQLDVTYERLSELDTDAQLEQLVTALERAGVNLFGDAEQARHLLEVSKAHVEARRSYQAKKTSVPVTLFRAGSGPEDDETDETLGWAEVCDTPVRVQWSPGDHVTMMSEPAVEHLARALSEVVAEALQVAESSS